MDTKGIMSFFNDIGKEKKIEIENIVDGILKEKKDTSSISVDIVPLVKKYDFLVQTADLPIDETGYLAVNDHTTVDKDGLYKRLIVVNNKFSNPNNEENVVLKKSRFITAHEFGHYILHKKPNEPLYAHRDKEKRETKIEMEADYFARSILMPRQTFLKLVNDIDNIKNDVFMSDTSYDDEKVFLDFKIDFLSMIYKVTKAKVIKRLGDIEILSSMNN